MFNRVSSYSKAVCRSVVSLNSLSILHFYSHKYMYHYILSCVIIIRQSGNHMQKNSGLVSTKMEKVSLRNSVSEFQVVAG